jgi:hypothetical protein
MREGKITVDQFGKAVTDAGNKTTKAGEQAAASAVKFQTLTQGAINLTTAFVQTETTISNLRRAKTSLKAAMVGVERANDLLIRKQSMLRDEYKKAAPDMTKIKLLTNEIATAEDDLIVKQDRIIDQREQLKDTYKLFALNLLNVSFSAIQTGVSMVQMAKGLKAATVAQKLLNVATSKYTLGAIALITIYEMITRGISMFNKELGDNLSIVKNATKMMEELGMVTNTNLENYETSMHKANESTLEFEKGWKDMTNTVKQETNAQLGIMLHWETEIKKRNISVREGLAETGIRLAEQRNQNFQTGSETALPKTVQGGAYATLGSFVVADIYSKLINLTHNLFWNIPEVQAEEMLTKNQTGQLKTLLSKQNNKQFVYNQQFTFPHVPGSRSMEGVPSLTVISSGKYEEHIGNLDLLYGGGVGTRTYEQMMQGLTPSEGYASTLYQNDRKKLQDEIITLENEVHRMELARENGTFIWGKLMEEKYHKLYDKQLELAVLENRASQERGEIKPTKTPEDSGFKSRLSSNREKHRQELARRSRIGIHTTTRYFGSKTPFFDSVLGVHMASSTNLHGYENVANTMAIMGSGAMGGRAVTYGGIGGSILADAIMAGQSSFGKFRGASVIQQLIQAQTLGLGDPTRRRYGFDRPQRRTNVDFQKMYLTMYEIDQTARSLPEIINRINSAKAEGNVSQLVAMGAISSVPEFLGTQRIPDHIRFGQDAIARGQVSMSAQWANPNFATGSGGYMRAKVDPIFGIRRNETDRNRNRMRTGGRRVLNEDGTPMFDLWDPRAVEGGFTSISAYRDDWWTKFRAKGRQAESFAQMLGNETKSAATYNTASSLIGSMNSTMGLLGRTGLSLSALPSRGDFMPRRAGGGIGNVGNRYFSIMAAIRRRHSEATSRSIAANQLTLKRAGQIDLLIGGFGLDSYYGSGLGLQELQLAVQKQDDLIQSIGLNRTEAFKIIDTQGRGRNEIDDRVRWTQRNDSISKGVIIL